MSKEAKFAATARAFRKRSKSTGVARKPGLITPSTIEGSIADLECGSASRKKSVRGPNDETEEIDTAIGTDEVRVKYENLLEQHNALKSKMNNLERQHKWLQTSHESILVEKDAFIEKINRMETELAGAKQVALYSTGRHARMQVDVDEVMTDARGATPEYENKQRRKKGQKINVPTMFLGVAFKVQEMFPDWAHKETTELEHTSKSSKRRWEGRSEKIALTSWLNEREGGNHVFKVLPKHPSSLAAMGTSNSAPYFTPSYPTPKHMLCDIIEFCLNRHSVGGHINDDMKADCIEALSNNKKLRSRMNQLMSDSVTTRKRNARDKLFFQLGYTLLISRKGSGGNEEEKAERNLQRTEALKKLVKQGADGKIDFGSWRTTQAQDLLWSKYSTVWKENEDFKPDFLFKHSIAVDVYHELLGYNPFEEEETVHGSILSLARLDAWIVSVIKCLVNNRAKGNEKQKMYIRMFNKFLPQALSQILSSVSNITGVDENVTFAELKNDTDGNDCHSTYTIVQHDWFNDNVSDKLGTILDCIIAKTDEEDESPDARLERIDAAEETEGMDEAQGVQESSIEKAVNVIDGESDGDDIHPVDDTQGESTAESPIISGQYPESQPFDTFHDGSS